MSLTALRIKAETVVITFFRYRHRVKRNDN